MDVRPPRLGYAFVIAAVACHWTTTGDDAGTSDAGAQTVGENCDVFAAEYCQQYNRCGIAQEDCLTTSELACCTGSACSAISTASASVMSSCRSALQSEDCNGIATATVPAECQSLL
jgi:hypothetical protein